MTRILLATHYLLWALRTPEILPAHIADTLADSANSISFSAARIWEIAIKAAPGKDKIRLDPRRCVADCQTNRLFEIAIPSAVAARVVVLPPYHKDPLDRLLVAQAMTLPARHLTADALLARYSELVWVVAV